MNAKPNHKPITKCNSQCMDDEFVMSSSTANTEAYN